MENPIPMKSNSITIKEQVKIWILNTLRESAWAPLGVFGFYLAALFLGLYDLFPPLDIPTHFMGGVAITYFYRSVIYNAQKFLGEIPLAIRVLLAFTATWTTTILWEFYENFLDYFFGTSHVRGLSDTLVDMFLGLFGALVLSLLYRRR
jgi:hypothetical protein